MTVSTLQGLPIVTVLRDGILEQMTRHARILMSAERRMDSVNRSASTRLAAWSVVVRWDTILIPTPAPAQMSMSV